MLRDKVSIDRPWFDVRARRRGWGVNKMASLMGMDRSAWSRTLNGVRRMQADEIQKVAELFECTVDEVVTHLRPSELAPHSNRGLQEGQADFKGALDMIDNKEEFIVAPRGEDPLFGCMAGTLTLLPNVDYTAPADPDWGKVYEN